MAKIETVLIVREDHPDGKVLINKCDFDPKVHKLWSDKIICVEPKTSRKRK